MTTTQRAAQVTDFARRAEDHGPGQLCNLARAKSGFHGQQNDDGVANRLPGDGRIAQKAMHVSISQYLRLFARHRCADL